MTKADISRHSRGTDTLSAAQATAAELVAQGKNDIEAAAAAGVSRQTVNGWRHDSPAFIAQVNLIRRELWGDSRERLRALSEKVVGVLDKAMDAPPLQALPAALATLKAVAAMQAPSGPTTPDAVLKSMAEARVNAEDAATPMTELDRLTAAMDDDRPRRVTEMMERLRREG